MKRNLSIPCAVLALILGAAPGLAGSVGALTTFTAGTAAKASEVNGNFTAVKTAVDGNAAHILDLEISVGTLEGQVAALQGTVAAQATSLSNLRADLNSLLVSVNALLDKTAYMSVETGAINGLAGPHVIISGANLHVQNGLSRTASVNGLGNLIVGCNEAVANPAFAGSRYGSHNLVIGPEHRYTKGGGLVAGYQNRVNANHASVSGGGGSTASGSQSSIAGGSLNAASGVCSFVGGGYFNIASGLMAGAGGGNNNTASGESSFVSGGMNNSAGGNYSSVGGGRENVATGLYSSVSGGYSNTASGSYSTVSGGRHRVASLNYADNPPDYDSGWVSLAANSSVSLTHGLGGDPGKYLIQVVSASYPGPSSIENVGVGYYFFDVYAYGFAYFGLNASTVNVGRAGNEPDDAFRILIWRGNY